MWNRFVIMCFVMAIADSGEMHHFVCLYKLLNGEFSLHVIRAMNYCFFERMTIVLRKYRHKDCIMRSFVTCKLYQILIGWSNQGGWVGRDTYDGWKRWEMHTLFRLDHEGQRPLWRPREDNIRMDTREVGWEGVEWIHLAQDRDHWRALMNRVMNLPVP
jgi:hypothetical protein